MEAGLLLFNLECLHCGSFFRSQGSLRAHIKYGAPKCRGFCIRCGCCRDIFLQKAQLAFHLNQPGVHLRPAASPPLDFPATATTTTTHTTTITTTHQASTPVTCTVTRAAAPPAIKLISPVRPIVADRAIPPSMPVINSEPATLDWLQGAFDIDQWLQEERDMSLSTSAISSCELVSPPASQIPCCTIPAQLTASIRNSTPRGMMVPTKPQQQLRPSSPRYSDVEPSTPSECSRHSRGPQQSSTVSRTQETQTTRDRSRSPRPSRDTVSRPPVPAFRLDQPVDYLYWLTLHTQISSGIGSVAQQQQFEAMDASLRSQLAQDSGPLGAAANQPFHVLLYTLSPLFAIWHLTQRT